MRCVTGLAVSWKQVLCQLTMLDIMLNSVARRTCDVCIYVSLSYKMVHGWIISLLHRNVSPSRARESLIEGLFPDSPWLLFFGCLDNNFPHVFFYQNGWRPKPSSKDIPAADRPWYARHTFQFYHFDGKLLRRLQYVQQCNVLTFTTV